MPSTDETKGVFNSERRNHDVDVVFVQAKRSENFDLGDFLKFKEGIIRFIKQTPYIENDETLKETRIIFDTIVKNVHRLRNGKPSIIARFVTTGRYRKPHELEEALDNFKTELNELGYFHTIDIQFIDRDELTRLWVSTYSAISRSITAFSIAALPLISGVDEAYLAIVKARDFVDNLLTVNGCLQTQVFEENVRSFLGTDNPVNHSIANTITSDAASRFPVLNNGITIVSPDIKLQGLTLHLTNYQIVNGCQTSNVLFEKQESLNDSIMVSIKAVQTQDEDIFSELVRATNSQTRVDNTQFYSLQPIIKEVEQHFNTYLHQDTPLYLERRERQYDGKDIAATRIFSSHNAIRCVAAMFCNRPDIAGRYPKKIYDELKYIFDCDTKVITFYAACMTMYRFNMLVANKSIPTEMRRFKWHILPLVKEIICGREDYKLSSKKAEKASEQIISIMQLHNAEATEKFAQAVRICQSLGSITKDQLKRQTLLQDMLSKINA